MTLRTTGYALLFFAMFSIAGGHWAVLQTVAWTGMIIEYSQTSSVGEAIAKTFGGRAPCDLCLAIDAEKKKESRLPATVKADQQIDKFLIRTQQAVPLPPETKFSYPPLLQVVASTRPTSPPAPVPIAA